VARETSGTRPRETTRDEMCTSLRLEVLKVLCTVATG
jgi:hypothetical protein